MAPQDRWLEQGARRRGEMGALTEPAQGTVRETLTHSGHTVLAAQPSHRNPAPPLIPSWHIHGKKGRGQATPQPQVPHGPAAPGGV